MVPMHGESIRCLLKTGNVITKLVYSYVRYISNRTSAHVKYSRTYAIIANFNSTQVVLHFTSLRIYKCYSTSSALHMDVARFDCLCKIMNLLMTQLTNAGYLSFRPQG